MEAAEGKAEQLQRDFGAKEKRNDLEKKLKKVLSKKKDIDIQLEDSELRWNHERRVEVRSWLENVERVEKEVGSLEADGSELLEAQAEKFSEELDQLIGESRFDKGLVLDESKFESIRNAQPSASFVGDAFQVNSSKIREWLVSDDILRIGIYGLGGVGKTTLVETIHKKLLEGPQIFYHVHMITIPQDFSIAKLQEVVAKATHEWLSDEDDETTRAEKLSKDLTRYGKGLFILDDLWDQVNLEEVGIPVHENGNKFILTTRSLNVCESMRCQEVIELDPLPDDASLQLFAEKMGNYATVSSEVMMVMKSVVEECAGSPLALVTLGGSMSGVDDLTEWTNVLQELKESNVGQDDAGQNVSRILKCCYARLRDPALQQCFLLCALFPEDYRIVREYLIDYLISAGVVKGFQTRSAKLAKGHTLLNKLERACLLEDCSDDWFYTCVKMHDLVRDVALDLIRQDSKAMVQAGMLLREMPAESEWTEDLEAVSLMENDIQEIPPGHSPPCPNLSTLLLCHNKLLQFVADSFFLQLCGLKVLDMSYTAIEVLPDSISTLVSLTCLLLHHCNQLRKIPSLAALKMLEKLDLSSSAVETVPQGLELLTNLSYLDMEGNRVGDFPTGILPQLSNLQYLGLDSSTPVEGEVGRLCKLEHLSCHFKSPHEFYTYVHHGLSLMDSEQRQMLNDYELTVGEYDDYLSIVIIHADDWEGLHRRVAFSECSIGEEGDLVAIPKDLEGVFIDNCHDVRSLGNSALVEDSTILELLQVGECEALECLVALSSPSKILESVKGLQLNDLEKLQVLISIDQGPPFPSCSAFSCLTSLLMWGCPNIKYLFPCELLSNLRNVESISIQDCEKMEEMIAFEREEEAYTGEERSSHRLGKRRIDTSEAFGLPKLRFLTLEKLPNLKAISSEIIFCDSIQEIKLWECQELKRISLSLTRLHGGQPHPLPSLKKIRICPEEWWDSAELDQPNSKDVLLPFLTTSSSHYSDEPSRVMVVDDSL